MLFARNTIQKNFAARYRPKGAQFFHAEEENSATPSLLSFCESKGIAKWRNAGWVWIANAAIQAGCSIAVGKSRAGQGVGGGERQGVFFLCNGDWGRRFIVPPIGGGIRRQGRFNGDAKNH